MSSKNLISRSLAKSQCSNQKIKNKLYEDFSEKDSKIMTLATNHLEFLVVLKKKQRKVHILQLLKQLIGELLFRSR